jgi:hypothetical protein
MTESESLYQELKPALQQLAGPLFDASRVFVKKRGQFLPHGAVLDSSGEVGLVMAALPGFEQRLVSSVELLPLLHRALRQAAHEKSAVALAACEDVSITPEGREPTAAIKVLVEHRRGLCVAMYLPYRRKLFGGCTFGDVFAKAAEPEVNAWETPGER